MPGNKKAWSSENNLQQSQAQAEAGIDMAMDKEDN
jgi:hypothetical protein